MKEKVVMYVTKDDKILTFTHKNNPEAGIQVPKGSIEPDEKPSQTAIRELFEESGLSDVKIMAYLGSKPGYGEEIKEDQTKYHFIWIVAKADLADNWEHTVVSNAEDNGLVFEFKFVPIEMAKIDWELDIMISNLRDKMKDYQKEYKFVASF